MDSLKQRILDYVSANQPAKVDLIYKELGICRNLYYEEAKQLRFMGKLRSVPGIRNECNPEKTEAIINELQNFSDELKLEAAQ